MRAGDVIVLAHDVRGRRWPNSAECLAWLDSIDSHLPGPPPVDVTVPAGVEITVTLARTDAALMGPGCCVVNVPGVWRSVTVRRSDLPGPELGH